MNDEVVDELRHRITCLVDMSVWLGRECKSETELLAKIVVLVDSEVAKLTTHFDKVGFEKAIGCIDEVFASQLLVMQRDIKERLALAFAQGGKESANG